MSQTYKAAGVDKEAGYEHVERIKASVKRTQTANVLSHLGGFSGLFELDLNGIEKPVLVSGTDGVGTKVKLAYELNIHNTVGIDCVAMCVNDIVCQGAKPLYFLDYLATGHLVPEKTVQVVEGVSEGCIQSGMALIGGETAEMPGVYQGDDYDLAGFAVGVVDKDKIITGKDINDNTVLIGIPSTGVHSNGFSLVRHVLKNTDLNAEFENTGKTLGEVLMTPTKIYVKAVLNLMDHVEVLGLAHITGGGLIENVPRMLPEGYQANIGFKALKVPAIFKLIQETGSISTDEMLNTFNMGVGMVVAVDKENAAQALEILASEGAYEIGIVEKGDQGIIIQ
ncbi:phosphoribosylformylglycinamidine cyclo-ligase [Erysipelothrix sp. HDW6A]|uniref:phosphoribosylformylglycinamidine cyclo-ligase n=1 Tax=Erysipelothrix sp. HDW6A TaxID=2714928 RepID=UPI001408B556|nr:phosphoribosylformylglycinamidine cyclo-ligase [Erysipelothrix sp. HDW6A]QIK58060.1 phosphoribosylformylglycinamidine cyclo-ligase [Erysipelothrix sp. HDW6A]